MIGGACEDLPIWEKGGLNFSLKDCRYLVLSRERCGHS
jgi:hypothetical protein